MEIVHNGRRVILRKAHFLASGGEGSIYATAGVAYKIYHDPARVIPEGKIAELAALDRPNVLRPEASILDPGGQRVGFAMRHAAGADYLCRLFTQGYRDRNGISPAAVADLAGHLRETLEAVHRAGVLVVDYNELNILVEGAAPAYHIDVDSYQTPGYPATAIMESVRDRKAGGAFTELSDWFSFAVVIFQLLVGAHPYKARHPDYARRDWLRMMDDGVSAFNPACQLPPGTRPLASIPSPYRTWLKAVLEEGERSAPPAAGAVTVPAAAAAAAAPLRLAGGEVVLEEVTRTPGAVRRIRDLGGALWLVTDAGVFAAGRRMAADPGVADVCACRGGGAVLLSYDPAAREVLATDLDGRVVNRAGSPGFFLAHDRCYTLEGGSLVETGFTRLGRVVAGRRVAAAAASNARLFDGLAAQELLGTCRLLIPFRPGACALVHVPELKGRKIIDARWEGGFGLVLAARAGRYARLLFRFSPGFTNYVLSEEDDVPLEGLSAAVLARGNQGLCVSQAPGGGALDICALDPAAGTRRADAPGVHPGTSLGSVGGRLLMADGRRVVRLSLSPGD